MSAAVSSVSMEVVFNNDYLLSEILIRLPVKSLIRFKSVTKHWRSLISDASFRHLHARRHQTPHTSFLLCSFTSPHWYYFNPTRKNLVPFNFKFGGVYIRQSCNGLLLLEIANAYPKNLKYYVYNPTTGESRNLFLPINENAKKNLCLFLAFDPLKSPHYKAICLRNSKTSSLDYYIEVYYSETREWKRDDKPYRMPPLTPPPDRSWVCSQNLAYSLSPEGVLFCFDTEKLMFRDPFFEDFVGESHLFVHCIMESFGHVHVISSDDDPEQYLVVHEITEKKGELSSEHLFHFDIKKAPTTPSKISCLNVIRGEGEEISLLFHIPDKIMAYHFYGRRIEELLDLSTQTYVDGRLEFGYHSSYPFIESLAPV